ncbi:MAG: hypothetical protein ACI4CY_00145 [Candidatus Gastranaerophilaceae bacterium]
MKAKCPRVSKKGSSLQASTARAQWAFIRNQNGLDCEVYITRFNQQGFSLKDGNRRLSCVLTSNGEYCVTKKGINTYLKKDQIEGYSSKLKELIDPVENLKKTYNDFVKV